MDPEYIYSSSAKQKAKISVLVPCHNEGLNIKCFLNRLRSVLVACTEGYTILFIDDGSTDDTLSVLREVSLADTNVQYISFSRNFGHQSALRAGLDCLMNNMGDGVIMMDADLEHPPELIPEMLAWRRKGYDVVYTLRRESEELGTLKRFSSKYFYRLFSLLSGVHLEPGTADFRLISRAVVDALNSYSERDFFLRGIIADIGFAGKSINYTPGRRTGGVSSYSWRRMTGLAFAGITSFSIMPLRLSALIGIIISICCFIYGVYAVMMRIFSPEHVITGWASLLLGVYFLGGIQLLMIGIVGEYVGRVLFEVKKRPGYIVRESSLS
jgi:dolichol-phosphate mannosyltransferase